jgi:hypothetical protein
MPLATEELYGRVSIADDDYRIVYDGSSGTGGNTETDTGLEYITDRYNTAAKMGVTILSDVEVPESVPVEVSIRDTTIFTGTIRNSKEGISERVRIEAYDAVADLKRNTLTGSYDRASIETIAQDALDEAGVVGDVALPKIRVSPEFDALRCDKVLKKVSRWGNAAWWADETNTVIVTDEIAGETSSHDVRFVRDASPGKRTPAYQSVRVIGSSAVSRRGLGYRYMLSSQPIVATAGTGAPVFEFRDNDIQSQSQAENVANVLLARLEEQQKGGWLELVGREDIRPFDDVELPPDLGGETYLGRSVEHTIDSRNGFKTRLDLGGLIAP